MLPHKHAVVHVTGAANPYYRYDLNGNLACVSTSSAATYTSCTSPVRTVSYTAFNMAATITQGASSYAFSYDSEHQRIKQVAPGLTTLYLNAQGAMSEKLVGGSSTTWRDTIQADGKMVAQRDKAVSTGTVTWSWFVTDHLGSVAVITNAAGAIAEQLGYDAWGKRRNAAGSDAACGTISSAASRGFTGHEMIDGLCLINMNARIYDPDLGRFMAADKHVTDPTAYIFPAPAKPPSRSSPSPRRLAYPPKGPGGGHSAVCTDTRGRCDIFPLPRCPPLMWPLYSAALRLAILRRSLGHRYGAWRSLVSAPVWGTGGRGFKSRRSDQILQSDQPSNGYTAFGDGARSVKRA